MNTDEIMALADEYVAACARVSYMGFKPVTETREALRSALESAIAEEREACAAICQAHAIESWGFTEEEHCANHLAEVIRARGAK